MNQLRVDPASGFLESTSPNFQTFDADKKRIFLDLALQSAQAGAWPDINKICQSLGINVRTFYNHREKDAEFCNQWDEVKRTVASEIAKTMHEHSKRPGNYMDRVTLLRHMYPEEWGGVAKDQSIQDFSWVKKLVEAHKPSVIATNAEIISTPTPESKSIDK